MSDTQWVQHISGQGEKWEVIEESEWEFEVRSRKPRVSVGAHYLPKSEYRLCEPPEVWVDVTGKCEVSEEGAILHHGCQTSLENGYRRRKVQLCDKEHALTCAIIIEKKVSA